MQPFSHEQAGRFIDHLAECHSWYKHIPLLKGSEFIIVIDPDAGRNYSELHPRLPFGNTKEGYQKAFGLLNYYHNDGTDDLYSSDCHDSPDRGDESFRRQEIVRRFPLHQAIRVFPYISWEFTDVLSIWHEEVDQIALGFKHESGTELIRLRDAIFQMDEFWQKDMSDDERREYDDDNPVTANQIQYKGFVDSVSRIHGILRTGETKKIRQAVEKLQMMLED